MFLLDIEEQKYGSIENSICINQIIRFLVIPDTQQDIYRLAGVILTESQKEKLISIAHYDSEREAITAHRSLIEAYRRGDKVWQPQ